VTFQQLPDWVLDDNDILFLTVIPGPDPGIHFDFSLQLSININFNMDYRVKPGNDEQVEWTSASSSIQSGTSSGNSVTFQQLPD